MGLEGRKALVTGASRGIGRSIAIALAGAGVDVAVNYSSDSQGAEETLGIARGKGVDAFLARADISAYEGASAVFDEIQARWGRLDILVNNAGVTRDRLFVRMKPEDWDCVIRVDLTGAFNCSRLASRSMMRNRWGRIINITSVAGIAGNPGQVNYSAAKAGLIGMTRTLARELGPFGVTVNAVAPGLVETSMTRDLPEDAREGLMSRIPLGRAATADDVAGAVLFLASDGGSYITGHVLVVDGGLTA
ncbi:MAG: 3-oxoacyl-[acyl-carrier-protein] reductase [Ignavibacteriales bacterium]